MFSAKHVRGVNVQIIDNQSILRFAPRTCRHSKADLCDRRIAKSALDNCVCTISGVVPLTSILMSGQFSHRPFGRVTLNGMNCSYSCYEAMLRRAIQRVAGHSLFAERTELTPSRLFPPARRNCRREAARGWITNPAQRARKSIFHPPLRSRPAGSIGLCGGVLTAGGRAPAAAAGGGGLQILSNGVRITEQDCSSEAMWQRES